jgi:hypothetical protein
MLATEERGKPLVPGNVERGIDAAGPRVIAQT